MARIEPLGRVGRRRRAFVRLLERGADDVIAKPFSYTELRARIAALLRRTAPRQPRPTIIAGDIRVDLHDRRVTVAGTTVHLSDTEYIDCCARSAPSPHGYSPATS